MTRWLAVAITIASLAACTPADELTARFQNPPPAASPWVFWHWVQGAVSREGITADLEAMKAAGLGGACLFTVRSATKPPLFDPPAEAMTPVWWTMVRHAMSEADRLGLQLGMHACDGFSVGGGPWITPELSMQKVVWTEIQAAGGKRFDAELPQPPTQENFYRDIAVLAFPSPPDAGTSTRTMVPKVTTSVPGIDPQSLVAERGMQRFRSDSPCWIQYAFERPFTCRSITVYPDGTSFQPLRLRVEASDDGESFRLVEQLEPPRHGWQNQDAGATFAITPTTARFFRFIYDPNGSEPGSEDLDTAKWRPTFRLRRLELFSEPRIHQFEGKTGQVWRIACRTTSRQVPDNACVRQDRIIDVTQYMDGKGRLQWDIPDGNWTILRLGHTSTGHRNDTGGAAVGLECDKFNPEAARLQFDRWFGEIFRQVGPELAGRVLKVFLIDSWEAGSQNWSPVFREEFKRRRGYDLLPYLPAMAGIPVGSAEASERFLYDVRMTIGELIVDNFFGPMAELAHSRGCTFVAENTAPTITIDGLRHFGAVDVPMGEFWLRSPTHDKPNDMLDAISAAHIYGKPIVQAEAFTEVRMAWDEHPALVKTLGDRNLALGINRLALHVFVQNPWLDRRPGMTLGTAGLFFQRDQTWWRPARAWMDYLRRCQALLQVGRPVVDVAVFTGEELPSRAVLPDRLVSTLPGIFGADVVQREANRLANKGQPQRELPKGVTSSANISDPADWVDPLRGYTYDSANRDALLRLAKVRNGRIELPGGASYALLVLPASHPMSPDLGTLSPQMSERLAEWTKAGVAVIDAGQSFKSEISNPRFKTGPFKEESFDSLGIARDFIATEVGANNHSSSSGIAWAHRFTPKADIYFISNQQDQARAIEVSLRVTGRVPELWDPMTGEMAQARQWRMADGRTILPVHLDPKGSIFVVLRETTTATKRNDGANWADFRMIQQIESPWQVVFDRTRGGPNTPVLFTQLEDWSRRNEPGIRNYSGTAVYTSTFVWNGPSGGRVWIDLGEVANVAEVALNGKDCGVVWTAPFRVEITRALQAGSNNLEVRVTNTWANRLIGDRALPEAQRVTWTTAADRAGNGPLLRAGLLGPVQLVTEK
jgi:hypothetical protein